jgi:DNA-binding NtrC family response regulator
LEKNYERLRKKLGVDSEETRLLGSGAKMRELKVLISKISQSHSNVLITGESGSGKEMVARSIHENSDRRENPFIPINCSAIPQDLLEAELFGYKKGAFTGANENRKGLFEEAQGGTLFLDEIGDMPMALQAKVLRVIQERKVKPLGESQLKKIDVRILAATHRDLKLAVKKKEFREDLYFRLCVIPVQVPSLRDRREDIPLLADYFLRKYSALNEKNLSGFSRDAMAKLKRLRWAGNVRELENTIERAVVLSNENVIGEKDITIEGSLEVDEQTSLLFKELLSLKELEKQYIRFVLEKTSGKKEEAAEILGINRKTLYRKEKDYDLN